MSPNRPLDIAALEDKIVQQAVVSVLNQIYEVEGERPFWAGLIRQVVMALAILLILSLWRWW